MPHGDHVTLDDIAAATGYGRATVARALSADNKYPMTEATRDLIRAKARALGYAPSWSGKVLATGKTRQIGLIYAGDAPIVVGIIGHVLQTVPADLAAAGYRVVHVPVHEDSDDWSIQVESGALDGCIVLPPIVPRLGRAPRVPTVLINLKMDLALPTVVGDDREGARLLTRHLLELGHRRIAFMHQPTPSTHYSAAQREGSYRECMALAGLKPSVLRAARPDITSAFGEGIDRCTAVICYDHTRAVEVLHHCWRAGLRVPQDLSVACFNDTWPVEVTIPPLTTIRVPIRKMAHQAVRLLLKMLDGEPVGSDPVVLPEELVVRESTAPPSGR